MPNAGNFLKFFNVPLVSTRNRYSVFLQKKMLHELTVVNYLFRKVATGGGDYVFKGAHMKKE